MNTPHFFSNRAYWGKLLGGFFGFLIAGPLGSLLGLLIGNVFDKGLEQHLYKQGHPFLTEKDPSTRKFFFEAIFTTMGFLAKSDGKVTLDEITAVQSFMDEIKLTASEKKQAQNYFKAGKNAQHNIDALLNQFHNKTNHNPELIRLFLDKLYQLIKIDGLTTPKVNAFNKILSELGFSTLHQQQTFYEDFYTHQTHTPPPQKPKNTLSNHEAYKILGLTPPSSPQEIKRAYRKLMSKYHPDKLISRNASQEEIKQATEKTQQIRKAYDLLS